MELQLRMFNNVWRDAVECIPFYADWKHLHHLPAQLSDIQELRTWPIVSKSSLIEASNRLHRLNASRSNKSVTGGATGEPLHFRTYPSQTLDVSVNKWLGWQGAGIFPDDRCFLIWGHRHFYGDGIRATVRETIQNMKDWLVNNQRTNGIDLSAEHLERIIIDLIRFRPTAVIAYSASLLATCRLHPHLRAACQALGVKSIICTAGPLTASERAFISEFFNAPVSMEYGSMEAGVMAYMNSEDLGYKVFRDSHIIHANGTPERALCIVTTLTRAYLPLIRYQIGDFISNVRESCGSVEGFSDVSGRVSDEVTLPDGTSFHGYAFMVCAEAVPSILAYQLHIKPSSIHFRVKTRTPLTRAERSFLLKRIHQLVPALIQHELVIDDSTPLVTAPSGKVPLVLHASPLNGDRWQLVSPQNMSEQDD